MMGRPHVTTLALLAWIGLVWIETARATGDSDVAPVSIDHHRIAAWLSPDGAHLEIRDELSVASAAGSHEPLRFLLHRDLDVTSCRVDGRAVDLVEDVAFDPRHFWAHPDYAALASYGHAHEIEIAAPSDGWTADTRVVLEYGGRVYEPLEAPEVEYGRSFETSSGLIDPRGAYLGGETFWLPSVPDDLVTFELTATVPDPWDVVSQGRLVQRQRVGTERVVSFDCPYPMDGVYLVAGPWVLRRERHGEVDLMTYTYAEDDDLTGRYLDATRGYLDRYERLIGPYPFSKFALVENFWETGYGMPSFTLLGSTVIRLPFIVHTSYGHEILHCWWGNGVFVNTDAGNWCEGLTSYMADYAFKAEESEAAARDYRRNQLAGYRNFVSESRDIPLSAFRQRHSGATQAIGYGKSLMVLHMLRRHVGDDTFHEGLRAFYASYRFEAASWRDLVDAIAGPTGESMEWFVDQWIMREGAPALSLDGVAPDGTSVRGMVRQTEPIYRMTVPVIASDTSGRQARLELELDGVETPFRIDLPGAVRLAVDPDFDVFRRLDVAEIPPLLSQTLGAEQTLIVIARSATGAAAEAYSAIADDWARAPGVRVVFDDEIDLDDTEGHGVWLFGDTRFADAFVGGVANDDGVLAAASAVGDPGAMNLVSTRAHPRDETLSWSWLRLGSAAEAAAVARKIPHYGKYSYLVFDGATNVAKGTWSATRSPLLWTIGDTASGKDEK